MGDEHTPALMAAFAVALSARTGQLSDHAVEDMRIRAEELMPRDHPAFMAVTTFATMYELHRRDAQKVADLGDELDACLRRALAPAAPDRPWRADLDG